MNKLPYTTPTGHTYEMPTDWESLQNYVMTWQQGFIEGWDEPEMPPNPTDVPELFTIAFNAAVISDPRAYRLPPPSTKSPEYMGGGMFDWLPRFWRRD